jgi:hypothetical protein
MEQVVVARIAAPDPGRRDRIGAVHVQDLFVVADNERLEVPVVLGQTDHLEPYVVSVQLRLASAGPVDEKRLPQRRQRGDEGRGIAAVHEAAQRALLHHSACGFGAEQEV